MRSQQLGILISFSLHILIAALVMMAISQPPAFNAPITLDFKLLTAQKPEQSSPLAQLPPPATEKPERITPREKDSIAKQVAPKRERLLPPDPVAPEKAAALLSAQAPVAKKELMAAPSQPSSTEIQNVSDNQENSLTSAPLAPTPPAQTAGTGAEQQLVQQQYAKENYAFIQDSIKKVLVYPRLARKMGWEGKVIVCFEICLDGHIENIRLVESSGHQVLDRNALETIRQAAPFAVPPARAELTVPVIYNLRDA